MNNKNQNKQEKEKKLSILSGKLEVIHVKCQLRAREQAYFQFETERMASNDYLESETIGKTKKKGVISRAIVGDVMFGGIGAVVGGLSSGSETKSKTTEKRITKKEVIDKGIMLITNERLLFIGKEIISIPLSDIIAVHFPNFDMEIKYPSMLKGESYTMPSTEPEMFFRGVLRQTGLDKSLPKESDVEKFMFKDRIIVPINPDNSINCPSCQTVIKDYKESKSFILFGSKTRRYTCYNCGHMVIK